MKKTIILLTATACIAACGNGDYEKWSGNKGGNSGNKNKIEYNWPALADSTTAVLISEFMNASTGTFWATPHDAGHNSQLIYWQQAHALDVVIAAYNRVRESNPAKADEYETIFEKWYANDANNYNNSHESDGAHGHFYNDYIDDMCWICLTMMHLTEALGDDKYIETAKGVYDNYIIPYKVGKQGLPWRISGVDTDEHNACTNSPACLVAAKLYQKYNTQSYLDDAIDLYDYLTSRDVMNDYRVEDPPLTYTQGTFGEACRQLYHITNDRKYMEMAGNVIYYAFSSNRCTSNGILRHEGTDMDQSLFKAVLIPYAVNYVLDERCTLLKTNIKEALLRNAKMLYSHLDRRSYPQMYCPYFWGDNYDNSSLASMGAMASGASLIEGVARL